MRICPGRPVSPEVSMMSGAPLTASMLGVSAAEVADCATVFSSIVILATAIYVGLQAKWAKISARSAAVAARSAAMSSRSTAVSAVLESSANRYFQNANSAFAPQVLTKAFDVVGKKFASLEDALEEFGNPEDRSRCMMYFLGLFAALENQHQLREVLGDEFEEPFKHRIRHHFASPVVRTIWREERIHKQYTEGFQSCVTEILREWDDGTTSPAEPDALTRAINTISSSPQTGQRSSVREHEQTGPRSFVREHEPATG